MVSVPLASVAMSFLDSGWWQANKHVFALVRGATLSSAGHRENSGTSSLAGISSLAWSSQTCGRPEKNRCARVAPGLARAPVR